MQQPRRIAVGGTRADETVLFALQAAEVGEWLGEARFALTFECLISTRCRPSDSAKAAVYHREILRSHIGQTTMDATQFDEVFAEIVVNPLRMEGFRTEGKSLYMDDGCCQFAWARGSGRLSTRGTFAHIVGFRHSFLRGTSEQIHATAPHAPSDYPWVLSGEQLVGSSRSDWCFDPSRLMALPYGRFGYATLSRNLVVTAIQERRDAFLRYVSWFRKLSLTEAHSQIVAHTDQYWIARLWDADYRAALRIDTQNS